MFAACLTMSLFQLMEAVIQFANARTDKLFGYDREQILGRPVEELFAERTRGLIAERFRTVLESTESGVDPG